MRRKKVSKVKKQHAGLAGLDSGLKDFLEEERSEGTHDPENLDELESAIEQFVNEEQVEKQQPSSSSVHVPAPLGSDEEDKPAPSSEYEQTTRSSRWIPPEVDNLGAEVEKHVGDSLHSEAYPDLYRKSYGTNDKVPAPAQMGDNASVGLYDMQNIVEGIDYEMANNTNGDEEQAKIYALDNLADDPDYYRKKRIEEDNTSDQLAVTKDFDDEEAIDMANAQAADLVTLPDGVSGTVCHNCMYVDGDFCTNKSVNQVLKDGARRMCCALWDADGTKRAWLGQEDSKVQKDTQENEEEGTSNWPVGLNLDLCSGQTREPGHVGIDTYPYDYGTYVHDLTLGIPAQDKSVAKVRLVNSGMDNEDEKALMSEVTRVLMPGGQFHYEGPNDIWNYPDWMDNGEFELKNDEEIDVEKAESPYKRQLLQRVAFPDPATADDAEPRIGIAQYDQLPADALLAMDALGYYWSDSTASGRGNRVHGYPSQGALLSREDEEAENNAAVQKELVDEDMPNEPEEPAENDYALPSEKRYPINDMRQAVDALQAVSGRAEEENVKNAVYRKFPQLRGDKSDKSDNGVTTLLRTIADLISVQKKSEPVSSRQKMVIDHIEKKRIVPIRKADKRKQVAYCVVLSPDELDAQDDWMTEDDIEDAAHSYMLKSRVIGRDHEHPIDATPVESYIAPQDLEWTGGPYGPQTVKKGSWVIGIKVHDPKEWQKVEDGEYQGVSVGGLGLRE